MKNVFLAATIMVALIWGTTAYSQDVAMATLQHGDNMQAFYGADGLKNALAAAVQGDLITLSAGGFNAATIDKGVTIQGAGYVTDAENGRFPTVIVGTYCNIGQTEGLTIEGIYMDYVQPADHSSIIDLTIRKCRLASLRFQNYGSTKNCWIDQCRIQDFLADPECENLHITNSVIGSWGYDGTASNATLCIENCTFTGDIWATLNSAVFKNNIIREVISLNQNAGSSLNPTCSAYNNVFISGSADACAINVGNMQSTISELFGKETLEYIDTETYELTESARTTFLGTDGSQVGIYGGDTPFTDVPTNPQVISKNIDTRTSADGKLKVNITVKAQNK